MLAPKFRMKPLSPKEGHSKLMTVSATKLLTTDGILAYVQKNASSLRKIRLMSR